MSPLRSLAEPAARRYLLVGVANTLFGLAVIFLAKAAGIGDVLANLVGYACGLLLSFRLNAAWTFRFRGRMAPAFYRFCAVIIVSYLLNLATVMTAIHALDVNAYLAQALGIVPYTLASYLGCRWWVFTHGADDG